MQPLSQWPVAQRQQIRGVFTDIDDTLTTHGAITPDALQALAALRAKGLTVIAITGRPIGWCEPFARGNPDAGLAPWPVNAIVAENGAAAFVLPQSAQNNDENGAQASPNNSSALLKIYCQSARERSRNRARMRAVLQQIAHEVPQAQPAQDSAGRETDIAIDHSEFAQLSAAQIEQVQRVMQRAGMTATVSSIHINGWFGSHNKREGARWIVQQLLGSKLDAQQHHWAFVGDSANDALMFEFFTHSIGVANVRQVEHQLPHLPRYITQAPRGAGFAEVAQALLETLLVT